MEEINSSLVDWSRAQFALTAIYHWFFVPLTLGLAFILAFMESIYVKTGNPEWKKITKFWMTIFGINFAIGVATGIILEFEFGTNWSNYSWFVGDIFGTPLAIEGIMAFFLESTFIAVMFFGWNKVSKRFHLVSTWLVAFGANISALWILVANGWMQFPAGMYFNPDTVRNEMHNFWEVLFSPVAVHKFLHTITSGFTLASIFVVGVSAWFLLKKRERSFALKSILVASIFGLISSLYLAFTGDSSARYVAEKQPMKFAAMEGLYEGRTNAPLVAFGILGSKKIEEGKQHHDFLMKLEIPSMLSILAFQDAKAFVSGINDLVYGNEKYRVMSTSEKIVRGNLARETLKEFKEAKESGNTAHYDSIKTVFLSEHFQKNYFCYFGYSYFNKPEMVIPNVPTSFYSFHIMVFLGFYFIAFFVVALVLLYKDTLDKSRWFLRVALWAIPLPYIASQAGWILAEVGRQPWVIQDYMPTMAAVSRLSTTSVQITFFLFAILFTALLIAEIKILIRQIKIGPKEGGH